MLRQAMESPHRLEWLKAIQCELVALQKNGTWKIIDRPTGAKDIFCKWVLKEKRTAKRKVRRFKARLVICGNFDDTLLLYTFASVVDFTIARLIIAVATQKGWVIHQIDYSNAFVQGILTREVLMTVPDLWAVYRQEKCSYY